LELCFRELLLLGIYECASLGFYSRVIVADHGGC
jgi:hypothetical protein